MLEGFGITVDVREATEEIGKLASRIEDLTPVARDFGGHMVDAWSTRFTRSSKGVPAGEGEEPSVQSGALKNSLDFTVRRGGNELEAGTWLVYGGILHFGGVIRPRNRQFLTIPLTEESYGKRAKDFADLDFRIMPTYIRGAGAHLVMARVLARDDEPLFLLVREVTLKPHPWIEPTEADWDYLLASMHKRLEG